jgi:hypothetical protein
LIPSRPIAIWSWSKAPPGHLGAGVTVQNTNQQPGDRSTGIYGDATQVWTLTNVGTITNKYNTGIQPVAVLFEAGGTVINQGRIAGNFSTGVQINGGPGLVVNSGSIFGYHTGITMSAGGTVTNSNIGSILTDRNPLGAGYHAISIQGAAGTVSNAGSIDGVYAIQLTAGGRVSNQAGGRITSQRIGIDISGAAGTVSNAGTIIGSSGTAVQFGSGNDRLILQNGATFTGMVDGGLGSNTIELAAGAGKLAGLGTSFINFGTVTLDTGGSCTLTGNSTVAADVTLTSTGTLSASGHLVDTGTVNNSGTVTLTANASLASNGTIGVASGSAVYSTQGTPAVFNTGSIAGGPGNGYGIYLRDGGSVTNSGTATAIYGGTDGIRDQRSGRHGRQPGHHFRRPGNRHLSEKRRHRDQLGHSGADRRPDRRCRHQQRRHGGERRYNRRRQFGLRRQSAGGRHCPSTRPWTQPA